MGTVTGVVREQAGWERVYHLLPAANPGAVASCPWCWSLRRAPAWIGPSPATPPEAMRLDRSRRCAGRLHRTARAEGGRKGARGGSREAAAEAAAKAAASAATPPAEPRAVTRAACGGCPRAPPRREIPPDERLPRNQVQLVLVVALLVVLHFYLRPRLGSARVSPDSC